LAEFHEPDPLPEGYNLGGFVIDRELPSAGMGRVYKAFDRNLKEVVAVNVLSPTLRDEENLARFRLAFRWAFKNHRALVYSYGEAEGIPFAVLAYQDGASVIDVSTEWAGRRTMR
jgi:hypothetical protein